MADVKGVGGLVETLKTEVERLNDQLAVADALASERRRGQDRAGDRGSALAQRLEAMAAHCAIKPWWQQLLRRAG